MLDTYVCQILKQIGKGGQKSAVQVPFEVGATPKTVDLPSQLLISCPAETGL